MTVSLSALRPNHVLLALAAMLAGLAVWPMLPTSGPPPLRAPAVSPLPTLAALPPEVAFAAVAARPLFSPSRRPPTAEKAPAAASGLAQHYRLIGVVDAGGAQHALLLDGTRRVQVIVGTRLGGFAVSRIEHDRIVLTSPAGETVLPLRQSAK